jgi:hypothetical protein
MGAEKHAGIARMKRAANLIEKLAALIDEAEGPHDRGWILEELENMLRAKGGD